VGTGDGLDMLAPGSGEFRHIKHDPRDPSSLSHNTVTAIHEDGSGLLWIGSGGGGLQTLDRRTGRFKRLGTADSDLHAGFITTIHSENTRYLWIGTLGGLIRLDKATGRFSRFRHDPRDPWSLANDYVTKVSGDRSGHIWILTDRGLSKHVNLTEKFGHFRHEVDPFARQSVTAAIEDRRGRLWIGTEHGVKVLDREASKTTHYPSGVHRGALRGEYVQSIFEDHRGFIWIGTMDGGLNRFVEGEETFRHYPCRKLATTNVMSICEDRDHNLWIGTYGQGLLTLRQRAETVEIFEGGLNDSADIVHPIVPCVWADSEGDIWIGTEGGGLARVSPSKTPRVERFLHDPEDRRTISSNRVHAIYEDSEGSLWISTGSGLDLFDRETRTFDHVLSSGEHFVGSILTIVKDDGGRLWLSTVQNGVYSFHKESNALRSYDVDDGLQGNRFYYAATRLSSGEILLGGENGYNIFDPDSLVPNSYRPTVVLTGLRIFNKPVDIKKSISELGELLLPYNQNYLTLDFSLLDYTVPSKNRYEYRLEGIDRNWVQSRGTHSATYTNIDPGTYIFRVRGSNSHGIMSKNGLVLKIVIDPPFWRTWWFFCLTGISILGVLGLGYRYRISKIIEIQDIRWRIARNLHDGIGSSLASIALTSDELRDRHSLKQEVREELREVSDTARETSEALSDMVWVMKPNCDKLEVLLLKLKGEASRMLHGLKYSIDVIQTEDKLVPDMWFNHNVLLIFKEALHNVLKHSQARNVEIQVEIKRDEFTIRIHDDGIGFNPHEANGGDGFRNMMRRATDLGGLIDIRAEKGKGAEIRLVVRIPQMRYFSQWLQGLYWRKTKEPDANARHD
jgi:ligand-binding sensor domain-containing protein/two-component sensor histidine kinase